MPDNTRQVGRGGQNYTLGDRRFIGINTNVPANTLEVGYLQDVSNMWVDGTALSPRPGWQAQFASSLANPIYALIGYRTETDAQNKLVFASGDSLYSHLVGTSTAPTHLGYGTWSDASQVRLVQHGKYVYGVPGKSGTAAFRVDASGSSRLEYIPQIQAATTDGETYVKSAVSLTGVLVKSITSKTDIDEAYLTTAKAAFGKTSGGTSWPSTWSDNLLKFSTGALTVPSGDWDGYSVGDVHSVASADWSSPTTGNDASVVSFPVPWANKNGVSISAPATAPSYSGYATKRCVKLDNSGEYIQQDVDYLPYERWPPATSNTTIGLYNLQFYSFANIVRTEGSVKFIVSMIGLNSSGAEIQGCTFSQEFEQAYALNEADWKLRNIVVDFREFASQLAKIRLKFQSSAVIKQQDILLDCIRLHASVADITTSVDNPLSTNGLVSMKYEQANSNLGLRNASWVKNRSIRLLFTSPYQDFSAVDTLSLKWDFESGAVSDNGLYPSVVLGLQKSGSTSIAWSSIGVWDKENRYISFNLFRLTTDEKKSIQYVYVKFMDDIFKSDGTSFDSLQPAFGIGDLVKTGESLTPDSPYEYAFTRWYPSSLTARLAPDELLPDGTTANGYESNISDVSNTVNTTSALTSASVIINPLTTTGSVGYTTNLARDRRKVTAVTDTTDPDQHLVTYVPQQCQLRLISSNSSPSITYWPADPNASATVTVSGGSWTTISGTNYKEYVIPTAIANRIKYVTSVTGDMWIEHSVAYGKPIYLVNMSNGSPVLTCNNDFAANDTVVFTNNFGGFTAGTTYYVVATGLSSTTFRLSTSSGGATINASATSTYGQILTRVSTAEYSHVLVYRRNNGIFTDGRFRLIAVIPYESTSTTTQTITGAGWSATYNNASATAPGVITLTDTVPDSSLLYIPQFYQQGHIQEIGRDSLPLGASVIATFASRVFMAKANLIYASWQLERGLEYGIYTTILPDLTEAGVQKKGATFTIGGQQDKEVVQAMIGSFAEGIQQSNTTSSTLYVLKENSVSTLIGFDPTTFNAQLWVSTPGAGIAAPMSVLNTDGQITWLSANGYVQYNNGQIIPRSVELRKLLSLDPTMQGPSGISKIFYSKSCATVANKRLFLVSTSSNAGAANQTVYVFDTRVGGWVKWTTINSETFRSITTLSFSDDIQYVYAGGETGQLYRLSGTYDIQTGGTAVPITWSLLTRRHGQTYSEGVAYYALNRAYQLDLHVQNEDATTSPDATMTVNWDVQNERGTYNASTNPYGISVNGTYKFNQKQYKNIAIRSLGKDIKGSSLQIALNGVTSGYFCIHAIHVHCYDTAIARS